MPLCGLFLLYAVIKMLSCLDSKSYKNDKASNLVRALQNFVNADFRNEGVSASGCL